MNENSHKKPEPIEEGLIELYNSSAMESLSNNGKLVSSEGLIDFCALDEYYQANQPAVVHLGGKSALMMSAFCQLNSFNMENINKVKQSMKGSWREYCTTHSHLMKINFLSLLIKLAKWIRPRSAWWLT